MNHLIGPFWTGVVFMLGGVLTLLWSYRWLPSRGDEPLPPAPIGGKILGWIQIFIAIFYLFLRPQ